LELDAMKLDTGKPDSLELDSMEPDTRESDALDLYAGPEVLCTSYLSGYLFLEKGVLGSDMST
jgi:hypothetical protein